MCAAFEACGGYKRHNGSSSDDSVEGAILPAAAALELLQAYLLIHDDWMDGDETRRGAPSVHVALAERVQDRDLGNALAILAGDLGVSLAQELFFRTRVESSRLVHAAAEFAAMQREVVIGQAIDMTGVSRDASSIEQMHDLKTGSYTVRGPMLIGAALAGASPTVRDAIARIAKPLGIAFQLRDDLLGLFGDPAVTGKPRGTDLRRGKRTALVVELERDTRSERLFSRVFGDSSAPNDEVEALIARAQECGAKERVEMRLAELASASEQALDAADLVGHGRELLRGAIGTLTDRAN